MKYIPIIALILILTEANAQQSIALFSSRKDSLQYSRVQASLQEIMRNPTGQQGNARMDSLLQLQASLRSKIIGYKITYIPNSNFTSLEDLLENRIEIDSITRLSISNQSSKRIPKNVYRCKNLKTLELVNTSIGKLPKRLQKLSNLKSIDAYNTSVSKRIRLARNNSVTRLTIRGVSEHQLPKTFIKFRALEELDLQNNINLVAFPEIFENKSLKKLSLNGNQVTLTDLPKKTSTLEELILVGNKITTIPPAIANFPQLTKLNFNNNPVTSIDPAIGQLVKLESLSFYNCKLTDLPKEIEMLKNLRVIDLYFNEIVRLNLNLASLTNLEILYLSNNKLVALPEDIGDLKNLREIYISNNKLSYLPAGVSNLTDLRVLRMNNNYFTSFPSGIKNLQNLENLNISGNDLQDLPDELSKFSKLQIFVLYGNPWEDEEQVLHIAKSLEATGTIVHVVAR